VRDAKMLEWSLHSRSHAFRRMVAEAEAVLREAGSCASFALSWSTGKDSTAAVHIARSIMPDAPILIQFDDCDWPTKRPYAERIAKSLGWAYTAVEPGFSVWDRARTARLGDEELCAQTHDLTRDSFLRPLDEARAELGCDGVVLGLRIAESRARKLNLAGRGPIYETVSGGWRCNPLWRWSATDVFAYHVSHGLEINPLYFNNRLHAPEDIRLSWALPTPGGLRHGDMEHMRIYWPEQYQRLREVMP